MHSRRALSKSYSNSLYKWLFWSATIHDYPNVWRRLQSAFLNNVRVTTIEDYDQDYLHPSIKHLKTDMSRPGFKPPTSCTGGGHSTKELFEQFTHLTILIRYSTAVSQCLVLCPAEVTCLPLQFLGKFPSNYPSRGCSFKHEHPRCLVTCPAWWGHVCACMPLVEVSLQLSSQKLSF